MLLGQDNRDKIRRVRLTVLTKAELNNSALPEGGRRLGLGSKRVARGWLRNVGAEKDMRTETERCRDRSPSGNRSGEQEGFDEQKTCLLKSHTPLAYRMY